MTFDVIPHRASQEPARPAVDMTARLGGLWLPSPVLTASGCAAAGQELAPFVDLARLGAVVTKSVMLEPRSGRPTPRMAETPSGMLNSIGLQGPGIEGFLERDLPWLEARGVRAVVSIAGGSVEEFGRLAELLRGAPGLTAVEVNISCPNVEDRGQVFACHATPAAAVVAAVRRATDPAVPVLAKLSPDVTDLVEIATACVEAGADGLTLINTVLGMAIDTTAMRPVLAGVTGGLSGPAIRPVAVRCLWQVHAALPDVPLLGVGGVRTGLDALELVLAGASAVSVGTAVFGDPSAPARVAAELEEALAQRGFDRLSDAVGLAHRPPLPVVPEEPDPVGDPVPHPPISFEDDEPEAPRVEWAQERPQVDEAAADEVAADAPAVEEPVDEPDVEAPVEAAVEAAPDPGAEPLPPVERPRAAGSWLAPGYTVLTGSTPPAAVDPASRGATERQPPADRA